MEMHRHGRQYIAVVVTVSVSSVLADTVDSNISPSTAIYRRSENAAFIGLLVHVTTFWEEAVNCFRPWAPN